MDVKREMQKGGIAGATEAHLRNVFRKIGWSSAPSAFTAAVDKEIVQLEREVKALKELRSKHFG